MEEQIPEHATMQRAPAKSSFWKTTVPFVLPFLILVGLAVYGYSNGWLKQAGSKAEEVIATNLPSMLGSASVEDQLVKARKAFAAGDINAAVEDYRRIVAKNPDEVAPFGELGNVYYLIGMRGDAAAAYFDAASKAIKLKQLETAESLLPVISEDNPMLAARLSDMLFQARMCADMAEFSAQTARFEQMQPFGQQPFHQPMPVQCLQQG